MSGKGSAFGQVPPSAAPLLDDLVRADGGEGHIVAADADDAQGPLVRSRALAAYRPPVGEGAQTPLDDQVEARGPLQGLALGGADGGLPGPAAPLVHHFRPLIT